MSQLISIGPQVPIIANQVYAVPSVPVSVTSGAQLQTSVTLAGPYANVANGRINGNFIKSAVDTTIQLSRV
jgi:hypothetical protein